MKILLAGDVVSTPGRNAFCQCVARMKQTGAIDFAVVNGENAAAGRGITRSLAEELFAGGADVITLGDHTWNQRDARTYLDSDAAIVRPLNFAPGCPGRGYLTVMTPVGPVTVISLIGRVFMQAKYDCPFRTVDRLLKGGAIPGNIVIVDIHAEATSEKVVMGRYLDGRVSIVAGTHTHIQTSDERVLPAGTAYITDLGMTGVIESALGRDLASVTDMFLTGLPSEFKVAGGDGLMIFDSAAIDEVFLYSQGVPRLINVICDKALLLAHLKKTGQSMRNVIRDAIEE